MLATVETEDRLLTTGEAAGLLGLTSQVTLRTWRCQGRGPAFVKVENDAVRYQRSALFDYIRNHTVVPKPRKTKAATAQPQQAGA